MDDESMKKAILAEVKIAENIADQCTKENRALNDDEQGRVKAALDNAHVMQQRLMDQQELRRQITELGAGLGGFQPGEKSRSPDPDGYDWIPQGKSLGGAFVESAQYKALLANAPGGRFSEQAPVQSHPWGLKSLLKQGGGGGGGGDPLITATDRESGAGVLLTPQRQPGIDAFYQYPLTLRQLVTSGRTGTDAIEYVRVSEVHNAAAPVPEATKSGPLHVSTPPDAGDVTDEEGGLKPQSSLKLAKETANVKTIAHWTPATKRTLADAAQVQTIIDGFLRWGLEEALEKEMVSGDGTGEHFDGLDHVSGTGSVDGAVGDDVLVRTRKARTQVQLVGRSLPTAYFMNPVDWEGIDLMRDGEDRFRGAGPFAMTPNTLWGLPVVQSEAVAPGTAWCADWRKAILWDREQAAVAISDSHDNFFTRNLVAIRAEMRAAFGVIRPAAFVKIDLGTVTP